eukprot:gnl/MRDRNA2_/MRDRNA2_41694_c0_seq1.p2 gnl/MRDRNA2_/MRDRNA2_41694_c0~~gnl/MRDRNA2_/MRDRNA2_41694_c0_seq1.p2  ORF type:complete len:110 (-),score=12.88 gnl/MRDRNA2_/MRDRNA2_41694_c0_seq1:65-394(-)
MQERIAATEQIRMKSFEALPERERVSTMYTLQLPQTFSSVILSISSHARQDTAIWANRNKIKSTQLAIIVESIARMTPITGIIALLSALNAMPLLSALNATMESMELTP